MKANVLLRRNAAYQEQVEKLLVELTPIDNTVLNMSAIDGGWSAIQTVHHLVLTEELSLQYVQKKLSFDPKLEQVGLVHWFRVQLLKLYLYAPFKFKAPKAVGDDSLPGFTSLADTRARWQKIRQEWTAFFEQMPEQLSDKAVYRHPIAGRFSWSGMLVFFKLHLGRHTKQIHRSLGTDR